MSVTPPIEPTDPAHADPTRSSEPARTITPPPPAPQSPGGGVATVAPPEADLEEQAMQVASTAQEQAADVAHEAVAQARHLVGDAKDELRSKADEQLRHVAGSLRGLSTELRSMAERSEQPDSPPANLARQAGEVIERFAGRLEANGLSGALDQVSDFGRRHPGQFLLSAFAAGAVSGRVARNVASSTSSSSPEPEIDLRSQALPPTEEPAWDTRTTARFADEQPAFDTDTSYAETPR